MTTEQLFELFGGRDRVMAITGTKRNAINAWRSQGVPFRHWPTLIEAAAKLGIPGINFETLRQTRNDVAA